MSQWEKLLEKVKRNPKDVRFDDACKIAGHLGFVAHGTKGSHHAFARKGELVLLNFQNRNGKIPAYQAQQLINMIEKYGDDGD